MKEIKGYEDHTLKNVTNRKPQQRLMFFRSLASSYASKDWREARKKISTPEPVLSPGYNFRYSGTPHERRLPIMMSYVQAFRKEIWADEVEGVRIDHRGWYSDEDGNTTLRGFVFKLSHDRWGSGYADSDSGERIYYLDVHPDPQEAAHAADSEAMFYAEDQRDNDIDILWREREKVQHEREDNRENLRRLLILRHHPKLNDVRSDIEELIVRLRSSKARLDELNEELGDE